MLDKKIDEQTIRLSQLSHGGGCGCKVSPSILREMLSKLPPQASQPELLLGFDKNDDAAVYKINQEQGVVATTDFFMPIVDDPFEFGRIAATNALSDVYSVGGSPIMALAIAGFPTEKMSVQQIQEILGGGAKACEDAGIPIAGGHTIDAPEPIYGLAAVGLVSVNNIKRNDGAKAGDTIILGKGLGVGILGAALNKGELDEIGYSELITSTTKLNSIGYELGTIPDVHAITDVTGFGLIGHSLEICRGSNLSAKINWDHIPILPSAITYAQKGYKTGAGNRMLEGYKGDFTATISIEDWQKNLLVDPQTSGGLLVSCSKNIANDVLDLFQRSGFDHASIIGNMSEGKPHIEII